MKKFLLIMIFSIFIVSNSFAEITESDANLILENYAKEDRNEIIDVGLDIYSITIFSKAIKALEYVTKHGRENVLVDKTVDKNGDSYNIIVPGMLKVDLVSSNPYGGSEYYRDQRKNIDVGKRAWNRFFWNGAAFNPLRPAASRPRGRK